jgi:hypothetical protein
MPPDALSADGRVLNCAGGVADLELRRHVAKAFVRASLPIILVIRLTSVYYLFIELRPKRFGLAARFASD